MMTTILNAKMRTAVTVACMLAFLFLEGCSSEAEEQIISGEAQGTTYVIKYVSEHSVSKFSVDSLLEVMDFEMNTWRKDSRISQINEFSREDTVFRFYDNTKIWTVLWDMTWEIHRDSDGAFDPTVKPLVDLWGFGLNHVETVDSADVDSIMKFVGFRTENIDFDDIETRTEYVESHISKGEGRSQLDFNAIAQGYTVDMLVDLLVDAGVENAMVELGGEVRCMGLNKNGIAWRIAVDKPIAQDLVDGRPLQAIIDVQDAAVCTSGNYRKFIEVNGMKYSHTLDPRTGYPSYNGLLSVTVQANSAA
ncbi:MAG: FAD:protein FMN transferase, partial [Bacteroidetes bacterium]|nr:FAD:protein FMN transferase [Bacteroidota bacterium]